MLVGMKIFAPASVANLAVGFDALGLCINEPGDEIIIKEVNKPGIHISKITGAKGKLPFETEKNTAGVAALAVLKHLGLADKMGFDLTIHKKMPFGSGLGSSAASAVAGAMAVNEILRNPLTKRELLPFALDGEQIASKARHADNVAPSLLGGLILCRDNEELDIQRVYTPQGIYITVIHPHISILTADSRAVLKQEVPLKDAIKQAANLGAFILSLYNSDFDLLERSLNDVLIEHQRASLIPHFYKVKEAALANGAIGSSISGAGPSIFALSLNSFKAENIANAMQEVFHNNGIKSDTFISTINNQGAIRR